MACGKHRLRVPARLVAAVATLLATGGVMVASSTADAGLGGTDPVAVGCRPDQMIALNDMPAQPEADRQLTRKSVTNLVAGQDRAQGSDGAQSSRSDCTSDAQPVFDGNEDPGGTKNGTVQFPGRDKAGGPFPKDFVPIQQMAPNVKPPQLGPTGSAGSFTSPCGTNAEGHRNSDNFMAAPRTVNGAQHVHDYVGNLSTNASSTHESLAAAHTTCTNGDKSTYFWPVLRNTAAKGTDVNANGGGLDGNVGEILRPVTVQLQFRGNPTEQVTAMPDNLAVSTGDSKAATNGGANAKAAWTCTGFEDRTTTKYPLCPQGSQLVRILDFPSCWDGKKPDSADHNHRRTHVVFPQQDGSCGRGRVATPQLRIILTYDRPVGMRFAVDTFPDQQHNPVTDHACFTNLMPTALMVRAVDCINTGRTC